MYLCMYVCVYVCMYVCMCVRIYELYMYVGMYVCMYVCMYATYCCHSISTLQSQTQTVVPCLTSAQLCRNIRATVP